MISTQSDATSIRPQALTVNDGLYSETACQCNSKQSSDSNTHIETDPKQEERHDILLSDSGKLPNPLEKRSHPILPRPTRHIPLIQPRKTPLQSPRHRSRTSSRGRPSYSTSLEQHDRQCIADARKEVKGESLPVDEAEDSCEGSGEGACEG